MNQFMIFFIFSRLALHRCVNNFVKKKYAYKNEVNKYFMLISIPFLKKKNNNPEESLNEILQTADSLYNAEKYDEAYDILTEYKDDQNIEVLWRISRILYQRTLRKDGNSGETEQLMKAAYGDIRSAVEEQSGGGAGYSQAHKWMAVILSRQAQREGLLDRVHALHVVRHHLEKAVEFDSTDISSLYMLGTWHLQMSYLNWFQRGLINYLSCKPMKTNFEHALVYFEKIEKIQPRKHIVNVYMLGKLNFELKRFYHAMYYLKIASGMDSQDEEELKYVHLARALADRLKRFGTLPQYPLTDQ